MLEHGPHTLRGLAEHLHLEQSTINRQIQAAVGHGYVERYNDPASPAMPVRATPTGETAYRKESEFRAAGLRAIVDTLGEPAVIELAAGLTRFNDAIEQAVETSLRHTD